MGAEPAPDRERGVSSSLVGFVFNLAAPRLHPCSTDQAASLSPLKGQSRPLLPAVDFGAGSCLLCSKVPAPQSPVSDHTALVLGRA